MRSAMHTFRIATAVLALALTGGTAAIAGCTGKTSPNPPAQSEGPFLKGSGTLRVLAGSELADLRPILDRARTATGVTVELYFTGTLDGVESVADGTATK